MEFSLVVSILDMQHARYNVSTAVQVRSSRVWNVTGVGWLLFTDVSGHPVGSIFKDQVVFPRVSILYAVGSSFARAICTKYRYQMVLTRREANGFTQSTSDNTQTSKQIFSNI
jgi:hypothetical protein